MKCYIIKIAAFLLPLCLLTLPGCRAMQATDPLAYLDFPLAAEGKLTVSGTSFDVRVEMEAPNRGTVRFLSPQSVGGMTVALTADGMLWTYAGHTVLLPEDSPACRSAMEIFCSFGIPDPAAVQFRTDGFSCGSVRYIQTVPGAFPSEIQGESFTFQTGISYPPESANL